jgi:nicotinamide-nucleotide amidase
MQAEIISIGDELLIGQTINTNAAWLGEQLSLISIPVKANQTITDTREDIWNAFDLAFSRSELIVVTGGLGPTKDDITKDVLCEYFQTSLEMNDEVLAKITAYFTKRGREMLESNRKQAELPKSCTVIPNELGTASGMWFEKEGKILISLPGVPYEMKGMMENILLDRIKNRFEAKDIYHQTIMTTGIGESFLAELIRDWEDRLRNDDLSLAYLPSPGIVKLRITSFHGKKDKEKIARYIQEVSDALPQYVYGLNGETLSEVLGNKLNNLNKTVTCIESCTGGGIAREIVKTPGASSYFEGGFVTYSNALKMKLVHVQQSTLDLYGAVSQQTVEEMAEGGRTVLGSDYAIAVSGIAGPDGGSEEKPVGTVWIAVASAGKTISKQFSFGNNRDRTIQMTIFAALNLLRCEVFGINK